MIQLGVSFEDNAVADLLYSVANLNRSTDSMHRKIALRKLFSNASLVLSMSSGWMKAKNGSFNSSSSEASGLEKRMFSAMVPS